MHSVISRLPPVGSPSLAAPHREFQILPFASLAASVSPQPDVVMFHWPWGIWCKCSFQSPVPQPGNPPALSLGSSHAISPPPTPSRPGLGLSGAVCAPRLLPPRGIKPLIPRSPWVPMRQPPRTTYTSALPCPLRTQSVREDGVGGGLQLSLGLHLSRIPSTPREGSLFLDRRPTLSRGLNSQTLLGSDSMTTRGSWLPAEGKAQPGRVLSRHRSPRRAGRGSCGQFTPGLHENQSASQPPPSTSAIPRLATGHKARTVCRLPAPQQPECALWPGPRAGRRRTPASDRS